ncbi:hypothetical protein ACGTN9_13035 [Halobacillus sp. MO56]
MYERWEKKKQKTRKARKNEEAYTFWDGFLDLLFWVPELLIVPVRMIFFALRLIGRIFKDAFDFIP